MGTIFNIICIICGSFIGIIFKKSISKDINISMNNVLGFCVVFIGVIGVLTSSITVVDGVLISSKTLYMIISLVLGTLIGEGLKLEDKVNNISLALENKLKIETFSKGFVPASMIFCCGAMAIIGSMNEGLLGDSTVLYTKGIIDGITSIILASTLGIGVIFSSISVFIYQGSITLLSILLNTGNFISTELINNISIVGYFIVFLVGLNLTKLTNIKIINTLPALVIVTILTIII